MKWLDFFKTESKGFVPKTSHKALRGFEADIIPVYYFIYKSTSVKPLDDKPFDMDAIDRIISRPDLELETNSFLMDIFEEMIHDKDPERALYAAESINLIESRYTTRIEEIKETLKKSVSDSLRSELARLYYELAVIHRRRKSISTFYAREAYNSLRIFLDRGIISRDDLSMLIEILISFRLYNQADEIVEKLTDNEDPFFLALQAKLEYAKRNYHGVYLIIKRLSSLENKGNPEMESVVNYWLDRTE